MPSEILSIAEFVCGRKQHAWGFGRMFKQEMPSGMFHSPSTFSSLCTILVPIQMVPIISIITTKFHSNLNFISSHFIQFNLINIYSHPMCRYVLERGDGCFTEFIGRNGGYQDIIIGSECAEVTISNWIIIIHVLFVCFFPLHFPQFYSFFFLFN